MSIKMANLPSSVAARRTREFRCPPNVQISNLLHMPGPGGPTGLLEELLGSLMADAEVEADVDGEFGEDEDGGHAKNPCAEEIKVIYCPPQLFF